VTIVDVEDLPGKPRANGAVTVAVMTRQTDLGIDDPF
jgi:hypothetical protein